jgi:peptidoglycan/LPS O-acetylase OafA/YrhL
VKIVLLAFQEISELATERILFAHYLRGIACLSVLTGHLCGVFWLFNAAPRLANTPVYSGTIPKIVFFLNSIPFFDYGSFGVALFFLISGFVIPFSLQKYDSLQFLIARFFRIVPPYIVGFSITILALLAGSIYYGRQFSHSFDAVFINAFLIQDLFWIPSIDAVAWTLEIELKFYLICAIIILWIKRSQYTKILLLCMVFLLGQIFTFQFLPILAASTPWFPVINLLYVYQLESPVIIFMFIGTMIYFYYVKKITSAKTIIAIIILVSFFSISWLYGIFTDGAIRGIPNYLLALIIFTTFFLFRDPGIFRSAGISSFKKYTAGFHPDRFTSINRGAVKISSISSTIMEKWVKPILSSLADISYPLYVVHGITNYVIMRILLDLGFDPLLVIVIGVSDSLVIAYILHNLIELPSNALGKKIAFLVRKDN